MDFTEEYSILKSLNPQLTYVARYKFNDELVRLYIRFSPRYQYLIVTTDSKTDSLIHSFTIMGNEQSGFKINGYWGKDVYAAWPLTVGRKFDDFYQSIKTAIHALVSNNTHGISIKTMNPNSVILPRLKLKGHERQQKGADNRFFWYVRSTSKISEDQRKKIKQILGNSALKFLEKNNLNAVFTDDPRKQRTLDFTP